MTEYAFDETKFKELAEKARQYFLGFSGKRNHNPYFMLAFVQRCLERLKNGDRSQELFESVEKLKLVPPVIDHNLPAQPEPKQPEPINVKEPEVVDKQTPTPVVSSKKKAASKGFVKL